MPSSILKSGLKRIAVLLWLCAGLAVAHAGPAPTRAPTPLVPNDLQLALMIKTTLIAFNQANITGNYTVLRDLAAPDFQMTNTAARLAEIFQGERSKNFDLSPIVMLRPELVRKPAIDPQGRLHVEGFFPSRPQVVHFVLVFKDVAEKWRLLAMGVNTFAPPPPQASRRDEGAGPSPRKVSTSEFVESWAGKWPSWTVGLR